MCALLWLGACGPSAADHEAPDASTHDASAAIEAGAADAAPDAGARLDADGLAPISACVIAPPAVQFAQPTIASSLSSLCDALTAAGLASCPVDRDAYLRSVVQDECQLGGAFPGLTRSCGVDRVYGWGRDVTLTWLFDAASGELIGANVLDLMGRLPCNAPLYRGGLERAACMVPAVSCALCVGEPDACPADIALAIPPRPCSAPVAEQPGCSCPTTESFFDLSGEACGGAGQCAYCSAGTCWADCHCLRNGELRYVVECTE